jgi:hypothetical protein
MSDPIASPRQPFKKYLAKTTWTPRRPTMLARNDPMNHPPSFARRRLAAGVIVALALLSAACSNDSVSRINAPPAPPPLSLSRSGDGSSSSGTASSGFTVLAHTAVSCTGGSITGDVGTFQAPGDLPPGVVTQTTGCLINGSVHVGDAAAKAAFNSFLAAYAALAPKPGDVCPVITGTLAGQTLTPGVYCVSSEAKTGTLTLRGPPSATWVIKVPSGALTGTSFSVVMAGGGSACNVTWWVDAAATMTTSAFQGNILAGAAITMTASTLHGNAWAKADVTFTEGTVVTGCATSNGNGNGGDHGDKDHHKGHHKGHHKDKHHKHHKDSGHHGGYDDGHNDSGHGGH